MKIVSAKNPRRTNANGIDLLATFQGIGEIPFHATIDDPEPHGRELYARAMQGEFGEVAPYEPPVIPLEQLANAKLDAINAGKNEALDGGFWHGEIFFDSDSKARLAYLKLATKLAQDPTYTTKWKASRGVWVDMDAALFAAVQPAYEAHIQACFAWQAAREQELAAAYAAEDSVAMAAVPEVMV